VPAVLYGHGTDTRHLTLPGHDLMMALKAQNALLRLEGLEGRSELALPKAVQRHPIKGIIEHVDLILVRQGEKVTVDVAVRVTGDVFPGGMLDQQLVQVPVEAEATNIPRQFDVDVSGMEIGTAVHASDLSLPPGVTLAADPEALVLHVVAAPTAEQMEAELGISETEVPAEVPPEAPAAAGEAGGAGSGDGEQSG
jgi:large subunit ribosomal protein L25